MTKKSLSRVAVYCGSANGSRPEYVEAAEAMARELAKRGLGLVYGGGDVGLMGVLADAMLERDGEVIGVIPRQLKEREVAHEGLTELLVVEDMHERKAKMAERADAFVAMPGGIGTLEELFEMLTWSQLKFHDKPCALLDVAGFYRPLCAMLDHLVDQAFLRPEHRSLLIVRPDPASVLDALEAAVVQQA